MIGMRLSDGGSVPCQPLGYSSVTDVTHVPSGYDTV